MKSDYDNLALDADGIPILTDLVRDQDLKGVPAPPPAHTPPITIPAMERSPDDIARDILASDEVRQQLDRIASDLVRDLRLQVEQNLANAIDTAISETLDNTSEGTYEYIRRQLDAALPQMITRAVREADRDD